MIFFVLDLPLVRKAGKSCLSALYRITVVQGKFAEPVKRDRISLFGLWSCALLFFLSFFFF